MVLAFVSAGYFESAPCNRELGYAIEFDRPIVLMREMNPKKGGISIESARSACPSDLVEAAFAEPHLNWHRMKEFQTLTLGQVLRYVMHDQLGEDDRNRIHIPGCPSQVRSTLRGVGPSYKYHYYVSPHNTGAEAFVDEVSAYLKQPGIKRDVESSRGTFHMGNWRNSSHGMMIHRGTSTLSHGTQEEATEQLTTTDNIDEMLDAERFLLYLDLSTWHGGAKGGADDARLSKLKEEVTRAIYAGMQVWLVHEFAGICGVPEFDFFLANTPVDLVTLGLYANQLAVPFHEHEHRKVRQQRFQE